VQYREFGRTGWSVSEIGFGGARIGGLLAQDGGRAPSLRTLAAALDAGINFYDTADMYAQGESEILIGKAFRKTRDRVFVATKGGYCLPAGKKLIQVLKPLAKPIARALGLRRRSLVPSSAARVISQDFSPSYIRKAVEASLRRLQSDYIDLYQLHSPPRETLTAPSFQDTLAALARLKAEGKIRHYGIALDLVDDAQHCLDLEGLSSLQVPFGLLDLEALEGAFDQIWKRQIGIIARGCFGGGALKASLTPTELQASEPKWERVLKLRRMVEQYGRSPLEAALQFVLAERRIGVSILGMRTPDHVATNLQYYSSRPLSDEELHTLLAHVVTANA
jgi:aryl-alcohol dehydrogenase-like predicted oxidoreductase